MGEVKPGSGGGCRAIFSSRPPLRASLSETCRSGQMTGDMPRPCQGEKCTCSLQKKAGETGNHRDLNSFNLAIVISFVKLRPLEFSKKHSPSYKPPNTLRNHYCKAIDLPIIH